MQRDVFDRFSHLVSDWAGRSGAFSLALGLIVVWAITGPIFGFSDGWQLVINTSTTIITFLMVFVVQHTQNRDGEAIQAKLDELILVTRAENIYIGAEKLSGAELHKLKETVERRAAEEDAKAKKALAR